MTITKTGSEIEIDGYLPAGTEEVQIVIRSDRNERISRISDVSDEAPGSGTAGVEKEQMAFGGRSGSELTDAQGGEVWYPIVDVHLDWTMHGTVRVGSGASGSYAINGMFHRRRREILGDVDIAARELEHWENSLFVDPAAVSVEGFCLTATVDVIPSIQRRFRHTFALLTADWAGTITVQGVADGQTDVIATTRIGPARTVSGRVTEPSSDLSVALEAVVDYVLKSRNTNAFSPTHNGLYLFYDLASKTYRNANWVWSWGPAVKLLLTCAKHDTVDKVHFPEDLVAIADQVGMTSTRFQIDNPGHETDGLGSPRWQTDHRSGVSGAHGYVELISGGADSNFLSGWAWIPLYEATGNAHYLSCAKKLADSTARLVDHHDIIPQDYVSDISDWTDLTINESVFGMEGLSELYRVTGDPAHRQLGETYIEQHIDKLAREDGLWDFGYWTRTGERYLVMNTRGMGWAMEGLLAAHRMMPDGRYLRFAEQLADQIVGYQHTSGCWTCVCDRPEAEVGVDDKSTPLWSLLLYQLYAFTGKKAHLNAARSALDWCIENLYRGDDPHAQGGLVGVNNFSGVSYRRWFPLTCLYSSAFLGLAILEEIRLAKES